MLIATGSDYRYMYFSVNMRNIYFVYTYVIYLKIRDKSYKFDLSKHKISDSLIQMNDDTESKVY